MGICSIYILWTSKRFKTNGFIIAHTQRHTHTQSNWYDCFPKHPQTKPSNKSLQTDLSEEIYASHADNVFVSLFSFPLRLLRRFYAYSQRLILWHSPRGTPLWMSARSREQPLRAAACGEITQDTEYMIGSHTKGESDTLNFRKQNWLGPPAARLLEWRLNYYKVEPWNRKKSANMDEMQYYE